MAKRISSFTKEYDGLENSKVIEILEQNGIAGKKAQSGLSEDEEKIVVKALASMGFKKIDATKENEPSVETEKKTAILDKYSLRLDEEKIAEYREKLSEFSIADLEKDLALALVENDPSIFSLEGSDNGIVPKTDEYEEGSLEALLSKYKKN